MKIIFAIYNKKNLRQVKVFKVYLIAGLKRKSYIHLEQKANLFRRVFSMAPDRADQAEKMRKIFNVLCLIDETTTFARTLRH